MTVRRIAVLDCIAFAVSLLLLALGHRIQTGGTR